MATLIGARHDQAIWRDYLRADQAESGGADAHHVPGGNVPRHPRGRAVDGADFRQPGYRPVCGRRGGGQPCRGSADRYGYGTHPQAAVGPGRVSPVAALAFALFLASGRAGVAAGVHQPAGGLADPGLLARLCGDLHRLSQARHAAEYRYRRPGRRGAAAAWAGSPSPGMSAPNRCCWC